MRGHPKVTGRGRAGGAEGGEWGSPRAEASGWKSRPPGCREEVCRADEAPGATRREQRTPRGGEDQPLTRSFCSRLWGTRTHTHAHAHTTYHSWKKGQSPRDTPPIQPKNWEGGVKQGREQSPPMYQLGQVFGFSSQKGNFKNLQQIMPNSLKVIKTQPLTPCSGAGPRRESRTKDGDGAGPLSPLARGPGSPRPRGRLPGEATGRARRRAPPAGSESTGTNSQNNKDTAANGIEVSAPRRPRGPPSAPLLQVRGQEQPGRQEVQVPVADPHLPLAFQVGAG